MADVIDFTTKRTKNSDTEPFDGVTADVALTQSLDTFEHVLIMGWDKSGNVSVRSGGDMCEVRDVIYIMEIVKVKLLEGE